MFESMVTKFRIRSLVGRWIEYRAAVLRIVGAADAPAAEEKALYELQAGIAADLQFVAGRLGGESRAEFEEIGELLKQHHSLGGGVVRGEFQREEFERAWHSAFIFLSRLKGMVVEKERARPGVRPVSVPTGMDRRWGVRGMEVRRWLRFVIQLGVLVLLVYLVATGLGVKMAADGRLSVVNPGSTGKVIQNGFEAFNGLWVGFFGTLVATYGMLPTVLMLGLLVSIVGYWAFRRA